MYLCAFRSIREFIIFGSSETYLTRELVFGVAYCRSSVPGALRFLVCQEAESVSGTTLTVVADAVSGLRARATVS